MGNSFESAVPVFARCQWTQGCERKPFNGKYCSAAHAPFAALTNKASKLQEDLLRAMVAKEERAECLRKGKSVGGQLRPTAVSASRPTRKIARLSRPRVPLSEMLTTDEMSRLSGYQDASLVAMRTKSLFRNGEVSKIGNRLKWDPGATLARINELTMSGLAHSPYLRERRDRFKAALQRFGIESMFQKKLRATNKVDHSVVAPVDAERIDFKDLRPDPLVATRCARSGPPMVSR